MFWPSHKSFLQRGLRVRTAHGVSYPSFALFTQNANILQESASENGSDDYPRIPISMDEPKEWTYTMRRHMQVYYAYIINNINSGSRA